MPEFTATVCATCSSRDHTALDEELERESLGFLLESGLSDIALFEEASFLEEFDEILFVGIHE
jgi:hypothetical protein